MLRVLTLALASLFTLLSLYRDGQNTCSTRTRISGICALCKVNSREFMSTAISGMQHSFTVFDLLKA